MQLAKDNRVHMSTVGDNGLIIWTKNTDVEMGTPVYTGKMAFIRNTYPAVYNHVVRNMNSLIKQTTEKKKRSMRGGHLFLYRYVVFLAFLLTLAFGIASIYVKACAAVSFILSILYLSLSIYNIVIYRLNHPLIHQYLAIYLSPGQMPSSNKKNMFYTVPLYTRVQTSALGALVDPARVVAAVKLENTNVQEIDVMFYDNSYISDSRFPKECVFHLILFIIMFCFSILFVSITSSK